MKMASKSNTTRVPVTSSSVRRNLFHPTLSRRPTGTSKGSVSSTATEDTTIHDDSTEIVIKDRNGNYQVIVPTLPPMDEEELQEGEEGGDKEKMEAKLLEMLKDESIRPGEPLMPELLTAVQSSLRQKVASLEDDNWIFEAERGTSDV